MFSNFKNLIRKYNRLIVCLKSEKSFFQAKNWNYLKNKGGDSPHRSASLFSPSTETGVKILGKKQNCVFKFWARERVKGAGQKAGFGFQDPKQEVEFLKKQIHSLAQIAKAFIETAQIYIASDDKDAIQQLLESNLKALEYAINLAESKSWRTKE